MMKCIKIADFRIGFRYDGEIRNDKMYEPFYSEETPDAVIDIFSKDIPYIDDDNVICLDNYYYYDMGDKCAVLFKRGLEEEYCSYMLYDKSGFMLYVKPGIELTDSFVFSAVDFSFFLSLFNRAILHSSFIQYNNEAILFCGDKSAGKSTQADLWLKNRNCSIVNGDRSVIYIKNGRVFAGGIPFCGSSRIALNEDYPVKAIVMLEKGVFNDICFDSQKIKFLTLLNKFSYNTANFQSVSNITELTSSVIEKTCIVNFKALKDNSAVDYLEDVLCNQIKDKP